jgi:hypothetical protein
MVCAACGQPVRATEAYCGLCASPVKEKVPAAIEELDEHLGSPADDLGRPVKRWSAAERSALLAELDSRPVSFDRHVGGGDYFSRVADAERLLGQCEDDLGAAEADVRERDRLTASEHIHQRAGTLDRHEAAWLAAADSRRDAALRARDDAREHLNALLAQSPPSIGDNDRAADRLYGPARPRNSDLFRERGGFGEW